MPTFSRSYKTGWTQRTSGARRTTSTFGRFSTPSYSPAKFTTARRELQARIGSYRALSSQFSGPAAVTGFSPATASRWIKFVSTGARVYAFSAQEFGRYFGARWNYSTPTAAFKFMRKKYGAGIKAVTRGKGGTWLVAATPSVTARPFSTYTWN